jgi:hypothetical protein
MKTSNVKHFVANSVDFFIDSKTYGPTIPLLHAFMIATKTQTLENTLYRH